METKKQIRKLLRLKMIEHFGSQAAFAYQNKIDEGLISKIINCVRDPSKKQEKEFPKLLKTRKDRLFEKTDTDWIKIE